VPPVPLLTGDVAVPDETQPSFERLLDVTVYAPLGIIVTLRDDLPKQLRQRRQALENRIQLSRFIGQLVVQQGRKELAKRVEESRRPATPPSPVAGAAPSSPQPSEVPVTADSTCDDVPAADDLPIAEYQSLAAMHVVQRLNSLLPGEIEQIRRFEVAHRGRRTILAKIAQLQAPS